METQDKLSEYAQRAYLAYAMSVVTGRAIPALSDGQKPVQRRILFAAREMGLHRSPKHVKSARVVGEVIGKWHPHGDSSVYEAMVRMAQDFTLRYPIIDGQGNFGSLDGDSAAAMRYTEAKLLLIAELLLSELDEGTVDFAPNYDGTLDEPMVLPARLPFLLLNGASGIAVGMATEIPSHNLAEVSEVAAQLVESSDLQDDEIYRQIPGPDFAGGGTIISGADSIRDAYASGRGTLRVRCQWEVESLAKGEWRLAITALPPGVSAAQVLSEIEAISNPTPKGPKGDKKKALTADQQTLRNAVLSQIDTVRDESGKQHRLRIVIEPKSRQQDPDTLISLLLAHTSLETNVQINLTVIDLAGRAPCLSLPEILRQWAQFRVETVTRRTRFRFQKVSDRIHILEGRQKVLLDIDAVIRVIRESDDPKQDLMQHFALSEIQAEDILEIRLRQLARLAGIEIERELAERRKEAEHLQSWLDDESLLRAGVAQEIREDAKRYVDPRRTTILETAEQKVQRSTVAQSLLQVTDEPVTVIISQKGWAKSRSGHLSDLSSISFKEGDKLLTSFHTRTTENLAVIDSSGRSFSLSVAQVPGGKGDGLPLSSQMDFAPGVSLATVLVGADSSRWLIVSSGGYGFLTTMESLLTRQRAGKAFLTLQDGERPLPAICVPNDQNLETLEVYCRSSDNRVLIFPLAEVKELPKGKGVKLMNLSADATLRECQIYSRDDKISGISETRREVFRSSRAARGRPLR